MLPVATTTQVCPQCFELLTPQGELAYCPAPGCRWVGLLQSGVPLPVRPRDAMPVAAIDTLCPSAMFRPVLVRHEGYWPCNPSIVNYAGVPLLNVRLVNYRLSGPRRPKPPYYSLNVLTDIDDRPSTTPIRTAEGARELAYNPPTSVRIAQSRGLEDIRLYVDPNRYLLSGIACSCEHNEQGIPQQVSFRIDSAAHASFNMKTHQSPFAEKNWVPLIHGDDVFYVYALKPWTVLLPGGPNARQPWKAARFPFPEAQGIGDPMLSGGTQAILWEGGYILIAHERVSPGIYQHRFVWLNGGLEPKKVSRPFFFRHVGVEFACGLATSPEGLVVSFGVNDEEAWLCYLPHDEVRKL